MSEVKISIKKISTLKNLILYLHNLKSSYKKCIQTQLILEKDCPLFMQRYSTKSVRECYSIFSKTVF